VQWLCWRLPLLLLLLLWLQLDRTLAAVFACNRPSHCMTIHGRCDTTRPVATSSSSGSSKSAHRRLAGRLLLRLRLLRMQLLLVLLQQPWEPIAAAA
jgi:hypothetical protein